MFTWRMTKVSRPDTQKQTLLAGYNPAHPAAFSLLDIQQFADHLGGHNGRNTGGVVMGR